MSASEEQRAEWLDPEFWSVSIVSKGATRKYNPNTRVRGAGSTG